MFDVKSVLDRVSPSQLVLCGRSRAKDPDKLKASMLKEIDKSDPEILKVALDVIKELNTLNAKLHSKRKIKDDSIKRG